MTPELRDHVRKTAHLIPPEDYTWITIPMPDMTGTQSFITFKPRAPFPKTGLVRSAPNGAHGFAVYVNEPDDPDEFATYTVTGGRVLEHRTLTFRPTLVENVVRAYIDPDELARLTPRFKKVVMSDMGRHFHLSDVDMVVDTIITTVQNMLDVLDTMQQCGGITEAVTVARRKPKKGNRLGAPLFEWKTVPITPATVRTATASNTEPTGQHHRNHPVRGHWRNYRNGKRSWVRAHRRGRGEGYIFHDYVVKPKELT